jgi:fibronectin type 3 domain-containing protein
MHNKSPKKVNKVEESYTATSHTLSWKSNSDKYDPETAQYYVVYRFAKGEKENLDNPQYIVAITRDNSLVLPYEGEKKEYKYVVTAVDAFHNESKGKSKKIKL